MIILKQFSEQENIPEKSVAGFVVIVIVLIPVFMAGPVDNRAMHRPHDKMQR